MLHFSVRLRPDRALLVLLAVSALLLATTVLGHLLGLLGLGAPSRAVLDRFGVDGEQSLPGLWSAGLLASGGGLMILQGLMERRREGADSRWWIGLGTVLVLLGVDDLAAVHEITINPLREALDLGGVLHFAWILPGIVIFAVLAAVFARFFRRLPTATRRLLGASGALFLAGALGMEMVDGLYASRYGQDGRFGLLVVVEEALELAGECLLVYTMLRVVAGASIGVRFSR